MSISFNIKSTQIPDEPKIPTIEVTLSRMSDDQRALYQALDLKRYC
jgi:hypothetical protein